MNEEQIKLDREARIKACRDGLEKLLKDCECSLIAEDNIGMSTKIQVEIKFVDLKKYPNAEVAQEVNPKSNGQSTPTTGDSGVSTSSV